MFASHKQCFPLHRCDKEKKTAARGAVHPWANLSLLGPKEHCTSWLWCSQWPVAQLGFGNPGPKGYVIYFLWEYNCTCKFAFKNEETLDPEGSFQLGKTSQNSVQFEGAICQFDIHPSAKAAHNYCKYIKKQCREADTYRPNLHPLLPLLPQDTNISVTVQTPNVVTEVNEGHLSLTQDKVRINHETSQVLNTSILITSQSEQSTVPPTITQPTLQLPLQATAQTATASFGSRTSQISSKPTQQSSPRKNLIKATVKPQILKENGMAVTSTPAGQQKNKLHIQTPATKKI